MFYMYLLSELENLIGLTRREVQELEKAGVSKKPTTKNKYGYLMYDDHTVLHLYYLKLCKEIGYTIPQMKRSIEENNGMSLKRMIADKQQELVDKRKKLDELIELSECIQQDKISLAGIPLFSGTEINYKKVVQMMAKLNVQGDSLNYEDNSSDSCWENFILYLGGSVEKIAEQFKKNKPFDSDSNVEALKGAFDEILNGTDERNIYIIIRYIVVVFNFERDNRYLDERFGEGFSLYFYNLLIYVDRKLYFPNICQRYSTTIDKGEELLEAGYSFDSEEMIEYIIDEFGFLLKDGVIPYEFGKEMIRQYSIFFQSDIFKEYDEEGEYTELLKYISKGLKFFYDYILMMERKHAKKDNPPKYVVNVRVVRTEEGGIAHADTIRECTAEEINQTIG